jgi:hypothetical protein
MRRVLFFIAVFVAFFWVGLKVLNDDREFLIKANAPQMIYHLPECPSYFSVILHKDQGDKYFRTEIAAQKEGFRKANNCP